MAIVKDHKGHVLAAAEVAVLGAERLLGFKRIDCPEKLFAYYFLRGKRGVRVEADDVEFVGRLVTRWQDNHRVWAVAFAAHGGEGRLARRNGTAHRGSDGRPMRKPSLRASNGVLEGDVTIAMKFEESCATGRPVSSVHCTEGMNHE